MQTQNAQFLLGYLKILQKLLQKAKFWTGQEVQGSKEIYESLVKCINDQGVIDIIEGLQTHPVTSVYNICVEILQSHFSDELSEEMSSIKAAEPGEDELEEFYEHREE